MQAALNVLEPLFRNENALEPERVSEKLHQNMFWLGRGGSITHTISGIDIALWDFLGKVTGLPVGRLLGGRYRERVKPSLPCSWISLNRFGITCCALRISAMRIFRRIPDVSVR